MTNGNGGTAFVNPSSGSGLKHSLRSATKAKAAAATAEKFNEEAAFIKEEEKMMDEEVTSEEEEEEVDPETADTMERTMLTVALVKSVVERRKSTGDDSHDSGGHDDDAKQRYGLRKRRRPAGEDLKRLEHFQSTKDGGLARQKHEHPKVAQHPIAAAPVPPPPRLKSDPIPPSSREHPGAPMPDTSSVPNPLSSRAVQPPSALLPSSASKATKSDLPASFPSNVPCPLPAATFEEKPEATASLEEPAEKRRVTINETANTRARGFSIDMDSIGLDLPDDNSAAPANAELPVVGARRDRAFSFECFAFGINADEPLPPLEQSASSSHPAPAEADSSVAYRPRGDSIIFDPSSFQDGGIHEQNALEKAARARVPSMDVPNPAISASTTTHKTRGISVQPQPVTSMTASAPPPVTSVTVTSTTSHSTTITTAPSGVTSFSMDLLNKDGRIGIYLPEARRARIARFHAKRAKRIWRKRIKYDCRKKLADSRPRIKGRFVKRSDMED